MMVRTLLVSLSLIILSGCGFKPLLSAVGGHGMSDQLAAVRVTSVMESSRDVYRDYYAQGRPSRLAQVLQDGLARQLVGDENARFLLETTIEQRVEGFGVRPDESFTRQRLTLIARYRLIQVQGRKIVFTGQAKSDVGVDRVASEYATLIAERSAADRNAAQVTRDIVGKLALVLRGNLGESDGLQEPQSPPQPALGDGLQPGSESALPR